MAVFVNANVVDPSFPPSALRSIDIAGIVNENEAQFNTLRGALAAGSLVQSGDGFAQFTIPNGLGQITGSFTVPAPNAAPNFPAVCDSAGGAFFSGNLFLLDGAFTLNSNFTLNGTGSVEMTQV